MPNVFVLIHVSQLVYTFLPAQLSPKLELKLKLKHKPTPHHLGLDLPFKCHINSFSPHTESRRVFAPSFYAFSLAFPLRMHFKGPARIPSWSSLAPISMQ